MIGTASALILLTAVAGTDAPIRLGLDATEFSPGRLLHSEKVDPALLAYAPTSPDGAFAASLATVGTGLILAGAGVALLVDSPTTPVVPGIAMIGCGLLMMNFGAFVGDLLNGDVRRFLVGGLVKLAGTMVLPILGPFGVLAWMLWVGVDVASARDAPARWVARNIPGAAGTANISSIAEPGPQRRLLAVAF
ncbi:MAG: hypothetical protein IRZ16_16660 [Myxococcaceae bacterium]|nr:hypothetical protein [Myxococcaceae bacterium]